MDRKKTILIAVMINAVLIAVLFVAALTTQEETAPSMEIAQQPLAKLDPPLFPDAADLALQQHSVAPPPLIQIPLAEIEKPPAPEESLVHKLPPLVPEPIPAPVAGPTTASTASPTSAASRPEPSFLQVVVKKGDSLDKIAKAHHTTIDEIIKANQLPSSFLRIGQVLKLPAQKIAAPKPKPAAEKALGAGPEYYTVKVGDNPWTVAMKHHMKVEELLKLNGLNEEKARRLKPGDRLRIR